MSSTIKAHFRMGNQEEYFARQNMWTFADAAIEPKYADGMTPTICSTNGPGRTETAGWWKSYFVEDQDRRK